MWFLMVFLVMFSELVIFLLEKLLVISCRILVLWLVSGFGWLRLMNLLCMCFRLDSRCWVIVGCISDFLLVMVWMVLISCVRVMFLSRQFLVLVLSLVSISWLLLKVVRMMVGGSCFCCDSICRVFSFDIIGMCMFISIMLGCIWGISLIVCWLLLVLVIILMLLLSVSREWIFCCIRVWLLIRQM